MSRLFATVVVVVVVTLGVSLIGQTDVSGTWNAVVELDLGSGEPVFVFTQDGEMLTGTYEGTFGRAELRGRVLGDQIEFSFGAEEASRVETRPRHTAVGVMACCER